MQKETALIFSWLNVLTKKRYDALIEKFSSIDEALQHIDPELLKSLGCKEETVFRALNRMDECDPESYLAELTKRGISLISIEDPQYPARLKQIADPPVFLYYKGSLEILNEPTIACVGKREMSTYGQRVTDMFVPVFIKAGMVTVSGLAAGIDAAVAKESIRANGKTVAVVGHGLADIYPSANKPLAKEIIEQGGLILSEFPLDHPADKFTFPARNRIIAGLSLGTVVLEAGEGSGACITADLALDYGREVFAVPGQIFDEHYKGCHQLIAKGQAKLVQSPEEVLSEIGIVSLSADEPTKHYDPADEQEESILNVLTTMPQSTSDIVEKAQLDTAIINAKLTMLELNGVAKNVGNGMWVRL
ncbi:MAG: DNA-protecting protein DprA [Candidatus Peribacter sp.]|jgi:DNA processing protein|nr:DNA-protecting protein DprA [Candidatus Peribacter sp.]MBT4392572.1 DNA-protecting protein DprA [Candidatus Peribacter sp.]MBT4601427.1 DNA-protecting protein DprA [Candidatus Peribacter sp.]MBT5149108.1 DNA-protecting protein DprA [Candidatus Peribacter sp.]MBT5638117.1 DNA-protecting protein DprA [Candidatus Peribacter sp.]